MSPGVVPGRVAEAIACGCVPLFVYSSAHEMKLPFFLGDNVNTPFIHTNPSAVKSRAKEFLENYNQEQMVHLCREFHFKHLSADAILRPILEKVGVL